ncbi:MAG: hypothetical protein QF466_02310 [Desulfobacterales bacterium]|nr:hypothetical protein [Desulfobacterales bacterium]MDP6681856.1 hypothetical protein [Desulfobacterales bacterium]MDP6808514.1 hypothetical protein [Desulfobacterales bacterium]
MNKIKEDTGLPEDFRALQGLRHVYASMLASSGEVDMYTLQKLLTHKNPLKGQCPTLHPGFIPHPFRG